MHIHVLERRLRIFTIVVLAVCGQATGHSTLANDPAIQSVAKPDADLVEMSGAAAYDAIQKITATESQADRLRMLTNLARWQVSSNDMTGARRTLAEAWSTIEPKDYQLPDLIELSARAGDVQRALAFVQTLPDDAQLRAMGKLAAVQLKSANVADAEKTVALVDALQAKAPREPAPSVWKIATPNFQTMYSRTLAEIGSAFAANGDVRRAAALLARVTDKGARASLLAAIAKAQHRAGDQASAEGALRQLREEVDAFYVKEPVDAARITSRALGFAGDTEQALMVIAALPLAGSRTMLASELSEALARDGDWVQARKIADATGNADSLILIGETQQRAGRVEDARKTLADAREALGKSPTAPIDRMLRVGRIVDSLIACGAFAEAVAASRGLDDLNRPPSILKAIKEEIRRGDKQALQATVPVALEIAQAARPPSPAYLADLATTLAKAGYGDDAKAALRLAQNSVARLSGWQLVDGLNFLRGAQIPLGDKEGAARTLEAIEEVKVKFRNELARLSAQGTGGDQVKALELLLQAESAADATAERELFEKAAALAGNNVIQLMAIAGWFSPQLEKLKAVDEVIAEGNFASALVIVDSLGPRQRDIALERLTRAQIAAGQFKPAFDTANAIRDPSNRASALIGIIRAAGPSTP
ncbi:MAG TPA: hypothetical protein VK777_14245 [Reyranella sp.]|jgi:hypothetical protein|nr:hypothetical protein [Reyranella sp.]